MTLIEYNKLKESVRVLEEKTAKAEGAYEQELTRLQTDYGVGLEGARVLLEELKIKSAQAQAKADEAKANYLAKWGGQL